jgi:hypothetical protein
MTGLERGMMVVPGGTETAGGRFTASSGKQDALDALSFDSVSGWFKFQTSPKIYEIPATLLSKL